MRPRVGDQAAIKVHHRITRTAAFAGERASQSRSATLSSWPRFERNSGELDARYADLELGLADCALVVIANRYRTNRIVSFDERHFRAVTPLQGGAFTILPSDS